MFRNLRLRTINLLVSGVIGLAALSLAILLSYTVQNLRSIEDSWLTYQADRSEKARLESVLRASIGYGGMIHEFKNYVLRHDQFRMDRTQANIGAARAIINQYQSLGLSEAEKIALEDISSVLNSYDNALLKTHDLIEKNSTTEEIDSLVKVDDTGALRGLNTLRSEVLRLSGIEKTARHAKGRIVANLRAAMGYGGMIHEFKNLVLRGGQQHIKFISQHINSVNGFITLYRKQGLSTAETIALDDITATISKYNAKLEIITGMILRGDDVDTIDKAAMVDDTPALRGLRTLDKEITFQVDFLAKTVSRDLDFLANVVPLINWLVLGIIAIAVISSVWLFQTYVIQPIGFATSLMGRLINDETDIQIKGTEGTNEIGLMAHALEKFRQNIISRKAAETEILKIATTDSLTGLSNRKRFDERIIESVNMAKRMETKLACLMIDLDKFKPINDTFGHAAGDEVLRVISKRLALVSRETDFVARIGGDEFVMIVTTLEEGSDAELPAMRIVDQLSLPVYFEENELKIGGSIGIAIFPEDATDVDDLLKQSDKALYAAKDGGRNTYRFASSSKPKAKKKAG